MNRNTTGEHDPKLTTRRGLFAVAAGALAAMGARALGRTPVAEAANGDAVILGKTNTGASETIVSNARAGALKGISGRGVGVAGATSAPNSFGVYAANKA